MRSHQEREEDESVPWWVLLTTYLGYLVLIVFGHVRDFFGKRLNPDKFKHLREQSVTTRKAFFFC